MVSSLITLLNHAKLKFYDCNYKLNITFAGQIKYDNEGYLDNIIAHSVECLHDIRVVRPSEASGDEDFHKLATHTCNTLLMVSGIPRILRTGSGQQDRLHRKRRPVQPYAAEDNPGSDISYCIHRSGDRHVQGAVASVEPFCGILMPHNGSILCISEVISQKIQEKFGL